MENIPQKKKPGLPARLTIMQRKFADLLVFHEGHKYAYECAKDAGYEGDNATLRAKASALQNPKAYPLVFKHIGELREEKYKKYGISFGGHLAELAKIRDEAAKKSRSYSQLQLMQKKHGALLVDYILNKRLFRTGKIEDLY